MIDHELIEQFRKPPQKQSKQPWPVAEQPKPVKLGITEQIAADAAERLKASRRQAAHQFRELVCRAAAGANLSEAERDQLAEATEKLSLHPDAITFSIDIAKRKLAADAYLNTTDLADLGDKHQAAIEKKNQAEVALAKAKVELHMAEVAVQQYVGVSQERTNCVHQSPLLFGSDGQLDTLFAKRDASRAWQPTVRVPVSAN